MQLKENESYMIDTGNLLDRLHCAACDYPYMATKFNYCPICGKKMMFTEKSDERKNFSKK